MSAFKKIWNDNVWGKVIASIILIGITSIVVWLTESWSTIIKCVNLVFAWLMDTSQISNWFLCLLIVCALFTLLILGLIMQDKLTKTTNEVTYLNYRTDNFYGITWAWKYYQNGSDITSLVGLCTKCEFQLDIYNFSFNYKGRIKECENCNNVVVIDNETYSKLTEIVKRKIHRNIRTGEWAIQSAS